MTPNKKWIFCIVTLCLLPIQLHATTLTPAKTDCILLGQKPSLIIKFRNQSSRKQPTLASRKLSQLSTNQARMIHARPMANDAYIVFFTPKKSLLNEQLLPGCYSPTSIQTLTNELKSKPDILYADPNILMRVMSMNPARRLPIVDPKQWDLLAPPGGMDAETAYATSTGSIHAIVAVLDTGILNNNSLTPNLISGVTFKDNGSFSSGATPSCDMTCNGYDHGTHVTGSVAASGTSAYGEMIYGVAPTAKVLPINVFTKFTDDNDCGGIGTAPCLLAYTSDQVNALAWLNGQTFSGLTTAPYITTINMSLGGPGACATSIQSQFDQLIVNDISAAIAAGNDNVDAAGFTPANCNNVMAIAATGPDGYGAFYSNYGAIISFAAPGGDVLYGATKEIYSTIEGGYGYKQGTSMAAPHVAGLSALLYSVDPTITAAIVKNIIATTATPFPLGDPLGFSCVIGKPCGAGIANANTAILAAVAQAPTLNAPSTPTVTPATFSANISWQPATWTPTRSTQLIYTLNVDGVDEVLCTETLNTDCTLNNLVPGTSYTIYVKATDIRKIHTLVTSASKIFSTLPMVPPTLTVAERNPFNTTQAFVYYSALSTTPSVTYSVNGITGATVSTDEKRNRFVINNINTPRSIANVTITASSGIYSASSNAITIPNII